MAGFFKGLLRANSTLYGDLEGPMTNLKSGRLSISIEKGKCIAWIVGQDDIELSTENVKNVEKLSDNIVISNLASGGGKQYEVNVYKIEMKNGQVGTLRLVSRLEYKVLQLIK